MEPQKSAKESGEKPQHSMSKRGAPQNEKVNAPKESVGGPDMPGKPPERTPERQRDSEAEV